MHEEHAISGEVIPKQIVFIVARRNFMTDLALKYDSDRMCTAEVNQGQAAQSEWRVVLLRLLTKERGRAETQALLLCLSPISGSLFIQSEFLHKMEFVLLRTYSTEDFHMTSGNVLGLNCLILAA